jgi:CHRD domain-containing protein
MSNRKVFAALVPVLLVGALAASASAGNRSFGIKATLTGYQEVPSISTTGTGTFTATVSTDLTTIDYSLTYSGLSSAATAAHIHFGQKSVNGGVVAFLCGGGGKPVCPPSGTVTGTIVAADILAVTAQGISAGELSEVLDAIKKGSGYVNVHTTTFPTGEIRGQVTKA